MIQKIKFRSIKNDKNKKIYFSSSNKQGYGVYKPILERTLQEDGGQIAHEFYLPSTT